jgi:hypothetical protein
MNQSDSLKQKLKQVQAELANATEQSVIDSLNLRISHLKAYIQDAESGEWHDSGWESRERNFGA